MEEQDPFYQQQDPFQDPFAPPQQQQQQPAVRSAQQQQHQHQQQGFVGYGNTDVQASINRQKAMVVKTLPDSVMNEFSNANTDRMGRMNLGSHHNETATDPFNPFAADEADPFAPPEEPVPSRDVAPTPPQANPTPATQQPAPVQQQQQQAPTIDPEAQRLVDVVKSCLAQELSTGSRTPMTIGVLSAKIKTATGKSWGGHWQATYGPLTGFLKKYPQHFTLIRNKYVVLVGREGDVDIPADNPAKTLQPAAAKPAAPAKISAPISAPKAQTYNPILPPTQPQMMFQPQQGLYGGGAMGMQSNSFNGNPMMMGQQQIPMMGMNVYGQPQQQMQFSQQQPQMGFPAVQQQQQNNPPFPSQFQQPTAPSTNTGGFDPFAAPAQTQQQPSGGNDWWQPENSTGGATAAVEWDSPLGDFESAEASSEQDEKQRRKEAKKERKRKEQEEKDAEFARKLQEEENARAAGGSAAASTVDSSSFSTHGQPTYVTLAAPEIRQLAEKEIGPENIKILSGFSVKKFGREGRPHQRKMWVTSGLTHLAWESSQFDGSHRGVELQNVSEILVGRSTPTIERSTKDRKKIQALCFSLVTQSRTVDLQACSVIQRDTLVDAMRKVIEFNHKHKPVRIDRNRTKILVDAA